MGLGHSTGASNDARVPPAVARGAGRGHHAAALGRVGRSLRLYTDRAAWEAALAGASITSDSFGNDIFGAGRITFDSGIVSTAAPASDGDTNQVSGGVFRGAVDAGSNEFSGIIDTITWTFPVPIVAFGADWFIATDEDGLTLTGNFDGLGDQTVSLFDVLGNPFSGFLGIIGLAPFTSVTLSEENLSDSFDEIFAADNLSFAAAVPEPGTLALLGAGFAGLGLLRRRSHLG